MIAGCRAKHRTAAERSACGNGGRRRMDRRTRPGCFFSGWPVPCALVRCGFDGGAADHLIASGAAGEGGALRLRQLALRNDPASPFRWCDLAEAYLEEDNIRMARFCFLRGEALGPRNPAILMRVAKKTFILRRTNSRCAAPDSAGSGAGTGLQRSHLQQLFPLQRALEHDFRDWDSGTERAGAGIS